MKSGRSASLSHARLSLVARTLCQCDVIVTDPFIDKPLRIRLHLLVASC